MSAVQAPPAQLPEATTLHNDPYRCPGRGVSHTATRTTEQVYGHLMPEALQARADVTKRSIPGFVR